MRFRWLTLTLAGTVFVAQAQNAPAPAAAQGPETPQGVSQTSPDGESPMNPPGPRKAGPDSRRPAGPGQPGGPGEQFATGGRRPMAGPGGPEGGPVSEAGPASFVEQGDEQGDDPEEMDDPEDGPNGAPELEAEIGEGPQWDGGPGFGAGPGGGRGGFAPGFGAMMRPPGEAGEALRAVLGLDDKQTLKLRQLRLEKAEKLIEARRQLEQKQITLMDLLEQEEPDGNALVNTVKSIHTLRKQAGEIEKEFQAKTAAALNDEQRAKLESIQEARQLRSAFDEAARFDLLRAPGNGPGGHMRNGPDGRAEDGPDGHMRSGSEGPGRGGPDSLGPRD